MALTHFIITASTGEAVEGLLGVETLGSLGGVVFVIYGLYKLGTIETVVKLLLTVLLGVIILYAAGTVTPSLQDASWYRLIAYIIEEVPNMILNSLGGTQT
jgi:uncharacterized membrane protein